MEHHLSAFHSKIHKPEIGLLFSCQGITNHWRQLRFQLDPIFKGLSVLTPEIDL